VDPKGVGPVSVLLNNTAAQLLARLCAELGTDDAGALVARSLGLLEMSLRARQRGGRLCFINERGEVADVVF
jgi:hypothetical protein